MLAPLTNHTAAVKELMAGEGGLFFTEHVLFFNNYNLIFYFLKKVLSVTLKLLM